MENKDTKVWEIHTMDNHLFLNNSLIVIGWHEMVVISDIQNNHLHKLNISIKEDFYDLLVSKF